MNKNETKSTSKKNYVGEVVVDFKLGSGKKGKQYFRGKKFETTNEKTYKSLKNKKFIK